MNAGRTVHAVDAIAWLRAEEVRENVSFVTSLPDYSEFPDLTLDAWKNWFRETAALVLSRTPGGGVAIFFQSDVKVDGRWVDKGSIISRAAEDLGIPCLFHKIFCRVSPGATTFGRPAYSHLLAFSREVIPDLARATADVIPDLGEKAWVRGMGTQACEIACDFIRSETKSDTVVNPFCGWGSVLAVANSRGLHAVGIEKNGGRADKALRLQYEAGGAKRFHLSP